MECRLGRPSAYHPWWFSSPFAKPVNPKILKVGRPKCTMDLSNVQKRIPGHRMDWQGRRDSRTHQRAAQGQARGLAETVFEICRRELEVIPSKERSHIPPWENIFFLKSAFRKGYVDRSQEGIHSLVGRNESNWVFCSTPRSCNRTWPLPAPRTHGTNGVRSPGNFGQKASEEVRHFAQNMMEKWTVLLAATCRLLKYDGSTNWNSHINY